ncbi:chemotaxis protein CheY [Xanthomonas phaseoli pv. phaseoli]|uniref:Chemotaxis protein CheY n=1 Tax=Xanthomonas campestris pv. phaseoli TaxID=317013 RepID=A0AB38E324_XANCH|nr:MULTISPECIES: response regulator transcription factor [Xanthomonas]ATS23768.1 response regulator transcription factor [Xanthomonas phaseoli pv. phaseoli]ATS26659.1 response regulator transcription factor [Xanthomonas phaseoli pv. phaseoli]ATS29865.1 response regulator transcription factor [Xanthomonas phaseoli pv. phaseoli]ATS34922.1 response regulator transcription factor [Xanthomonas phaseoli pv. phaseoli]AZU11730.1 chemotaxis protein CheY [Xanthomonas phaseoli pv. phaseoli]
MHRITVGIADDHPIVLLGVTSVLKDQLDLEIVFSCDVIEQLLDHIAERPVDVLLCDFEFESDPQADGLHLLQRLRRMAPAMRLLVVSAHSSPAIVSAALELGAAGFIGKSRADFGNLANAVRDVAAGALYIPPALSAALLATRYSKSRTIGIGTLSPKEASVARMTAEGLTIIEIAARLNRSPKTISNQKVAAMKKLGAKNDAELATLMQKF